jgi:hypothetical protein
MAACWPRPPSTASRRRRRRSISKLLRAQACNMPVRNWLAQLQSAAACARLRRRAQLWPLSHWERRPLADAREQLELEAQDRAPVSPAHRRSMPATGIIDAATRTGLRVAGLIGAPCVQRRCSASIVPRHRLRTSAPHASADARAAPSPNRLAGVQLPPRRTAVVHRLGQAGRGLREHARRRAVAGIAIAADPGREVLPSAVVPMKRRSKKPRRRDSASGPSPERGQHEALEQRARRRERRGRREGREARRQRRARAASPRSPRPVATASS